MISFNVNEIQIYEDKFKDYDILKNVITTRDQEDAFYILDLGIIMKQHQEWIKKMPRIVPYYAIKCNPNPMVIKVLAAMNANFDCASKQEIQQIIQLGISPDRIIFANPTKCPSHIKFAKSLGVKKMTVDGKLELFKIKKLFPEAKIVIRFRCDSNSSFAKYINLGIKYGCEPGDEAKELIQLAKDLDLILYGFSFHVGSPCKEFNAYKRGIEICKDLITFAKSIGCEDIKLIDIGGGFPGEIGIEIEEISYIINDAIKEIDPTIEIISEPGRYYVASAFTLASYLHSKKTISSGNSLKQMYYINCGVYTGFIEELYDLKSRHPNSLFNPISNKKFSSTLWGPTLDSFDCIIKDVLLPEYEIGDWLVWSDMGAYGTSIVSKFNGFMPPEVLPFIRKSQWQDFCAIIGRNVNCHLFGLE
ncbi:ornithine decarboxylase 1-like [Vespula pensylvanica]|uniref:ornithine decarboxylase 1-like n=1 Tax=Vespula pensylvanica TaxID=30213 RepID=UPI001CBA5AD9|nr:ornithine decarboxylase 1-like [Vespula pensylvanica]